MTDCKHLTNYELGHIQTNYADIQLFAQKVTSI